MVVGNVSELFAVVFWDDELVLDELACCLQTVGRQVREPHDPG